ncbi:MAG: 2-amino-4-hydroxy-6-hydroxymethyldihydropteridine diphosphokinase [Candidatus Omnitrophica bacterium]|nr:2-amino-4-hydroxy-6-hydroxymethyldihydropteridine diphosphokinase [Candidatus Omnitrophota bacterium]
MTFAYLSLGSNIHPSKNVRACLKKLNQTFILRRVSSVYETSPVGPVGKRNFWNLAVEIKTTCPKKNLLRELRAIETELGRRRGENKFAPRPIDIDLIFYRKWRRPGFERLAFVIFPLAEIAPRLKVGRRKIRISEWVRNFHDPKQKIRKIRKPFLLGKS